MIVIDRESAAGEFQLAGRRGAAFAVKIAFEIDAVIEYDALIVGGVRSGDQSDKEKKSNLKQWFRPADCWQQRTPGAACGPRETPLFRLRSQAS